VVEVEGIELAVVDICHIAAEVWQCSQSL